MRAPLRCFGRGFASDGLTARRSVPPSAPAAKRPSPASTNGCRRRAARPLIEGVRLASRSCRKTASPAEILATLPVAIAALLRQRQGRRRSPPTRRAAPPTICLRMVHGAPVARSWPTRSTTYFTAVIDNGLNTSAFTARVVASSRRLAGLRRARRLLRLYRAAARRRAGPDPRHARRGGGERRRRRLGRAQARRRRAADGVRPPRLPLRRPARHVLRSALDRIGETLGPGTGRLAFAAEVERAVAAAFAQLKPGRPPLQPNVEINAALLLDAVGFPRDAFTPVFAVGARAGWLAHAMEQQKEGRLVRPSSRLCRPAAGLGRRGVTIDPWSD